MKKLLVKSMQLLTVYLLIGQTVIAQEKNDMIFWGIFEEGIQSNLPKVDDYGEAFDKKASIVMWYLGWDANNRPAFPVSTCNNVWNAGYVPHIVWEPWMGLDGVISGTYDTEIENFGKAIASFGKPVMIRFAHEFNGDWYPWSYIDGAVVPAAKWITAYKHVHDIVVNAGGRNAIWLWSPNNGNGGNNPQDITSYYPGDEYVDWIAIDGYNWGTTQSWSSWTMFSGVFNNVYQKCVDNYPKKPIMLGEMGCTSTGGDKAAWITDMFDQLINNFTHIKAFVWFNVVKETDWRFNSTTESTNAYDAALADTTVKYDINLLLSISYSQVTISGKTEIVPGESNLTYSISPYNSEWTVLWETTGDAQISGNTNNDTVIVDWGCNADTLKCTIFRIHDTVYTSLVPVIIDPFIEGQLFADSLETNIPLNTQIMANAIYSWELPAGITFSGIQDSSSISINWGVATDTVKLSISSTCGNFTANKIIYLSGQYPYPDPSSPHELPGIIESNEYDYGGEGIAYHDADPQNQGPGNRSDEGVDTEFNDGGENVGWTNAGEWLKYTIKVTQPGSYFTELRVASQPGGGQLTISLNDVDVLSNINIGATGGWSAFSSVYPGTIDLTENDTVLKYTFNTANFNLGRLIFWEIDNESPSIPANLYGEANTTAINLNWDKATDNQKLLGYNVFVDGIFKAMVSDTNYNLTGLEPNTTYKVGITAMDIQQNESDTIQDNFTTNPSSVHDQLKDELFSISPNPVSLGDVINISLSDELAINKSVIRIYDMTGRILFEYITDKTKTEINTFLLGNAGQYMIVVINDKRIASRKILIK